MGITHMVGGYCVQTKRSFEFRFLCLSDVWSFFGGIFQGLWEAGLSGYVNVCLCLLLRIIMYIYI